MSRTPAQLDFLEEMRRLSPNARYYEAAFSTMGLDAQLETLNAVAEASARFRPAIVREDGAAFADRRRTEAIYPDPVDPPKPEGSLFYAHVMRDLGLVAIGNRVGELFSTGTLLRKDPDFDLDGWIYENDAKRGDIPDALMAEIAWRDGPFQSVQSEAHLYWLIAMRQQAREFDAIIASNGTLKNLAAGFGAQFLNPLNYLIPGAVAGVAGRGAATGAAATGRVPFLASSTAGANIARGAITAATDESIITALDYGDRTWGDAVANTLLSTVFDSAVQGIVSAAPLLARSLRDHFGGEIPRLEEPTVAPAPHDDWGDLDFAATQEAEVRSAQAILDDFIREQRAEAARQRDTADQAAAAVRTRAQFDQAIDESMRSTAQNAEREARAAETISAWKAQFPEPPTPTARTADGELIYANHRDAAIAAGIVQRGIQRDRQFRGDATLPAPRVEVVPLLGGAGYAVRTRSPLEISAAGTPSAAARSAVSGAPSKTLEGSTPSVRTQAPEPGSQRSTATPAPAATTRTGEPSYTVGPVKISTAAGELELGARDPVTARIITQASADVAENLRLAAETRPTLDRALTEATQGIEGIEFESSRLKLRPRLEEKIADGKPAQTISDYLAARLVIDRLDAVEELKARLESQGLRIIEDDDFLELGKAKKGGHRARNLQVLFPNGHSAEIQIVTRETYALRNESHRLYEIMRRPGVGKEEYLAAQAEAVRLNEEAWAAFQARQSGPVPRGTGEPREPWQMTNSELRDAINPSDRETLERARPLLRAMFPEYTLDNDPWGIARAVERGDELPRVPLVEFTQKHRALVEAAVRAGKPVPAEVLADYPDIKSPRQTAENAPGAAGGAPGPTARPTAAQPKPAAATTLTEPKMDLAAPGREGTLRLPDGSSRAVQYAVVPIERIITSHDPTQGFRKNPGADINERPYEDITEGAASRATVRRIAEDPDTATLLSDTPTATDGPPMVSPSGVVIGGNARAMAQMVKYQRGGDLADGLRTDIEAAATKFGIDPAAIAGIERPILVRVVADPGKPGELSRILNVAFTTAKTANTEAVSRGAKITLEVSRRISSIIGDRTMGEALNDPRVASRIMGELREAEALTDADIIAITDARGIPTATGKDIIQGALLGSVVPEVRAIAEIPASTRQVLLRSIPQLIQLREIGRSLEWDQLFTDALAAVAEVRRNAGSLTREDVLSRAPSMFDEPWRDNPLAIQFARELLNDTPAKTAGRLAEFAQRMADIDAGQLSLLTGEVESPSQAFADIFGDGVIPDDQPLFAMGAAGSSLALPRGFNQPPRHDGAVGWDAYDLASEADLTEAGTTARSTLSRAQRAAGEGLRRAGIKTTNPMVRLLTSPNRAIAAVTNRLFRTGLPLKGQLGERARAWRGERWSDTVLAAGETKKFAGNAVNEATSAVVRESVGRLRGKLSDISTRIAGRNKWRNAVWNLVDQTAAEAGTIIRLARELDPDAKLGDVEAAAATTLRDRLGRRLESDPQLAEARVTAKTINIDTLVAESIRVARLLRGETFALARQSIALSRRMDAGDPATPKLRTLLRALGNEDAIARLDETLADVQAGRKPPTALDNVRIQLIGDLNRQRLSLGQLSRTIRNRIADVQVGLFANGARAGEDEVARALFAAMDPELAAGIQVRPELAAVMRELGISGADFAHIGRASLTKTVNVNADAKINLALRESLAGVYDELLMDPARILDASDTDAMLRAMREDVEAASAEFALKRETPEYERAVADLRDLEAEIRLLLGLTGDTPDAMDRAVASIQSLTTTTFLAASQPALIFEAAQVAATAGGARHLATAAVPGWRRIVRDLEALRVSNPDAAAMVQEFFLNVTAVSPVKNSRAFERVGVYHRADLPPDVAPASLPARLGGIWLGLVRRGSDAVLSGDIPGISAIPIIGSIFKRTSFGGIADSLQKAAAVFHFGNVWDLVGDLERIDWLSRIYTPERAIVEARKAGEINYASWQPAMVAEMSQYLDSPDLIYLRDLRSRVAEIEKADMTPAAKTQALLDAGVVNLGGNYIPIEIAGNPRHNRTAVRYAQLLNYLIQDVSTTTPSAINQPLRLASGRFVRAFFQFFAHPSTFVSTGYGAKIGLYDIRHQAATMSMLLSAALLDKVSRQWLSHGWEEGNERIETQWKERRASFVSDVIGRSSMLGLMEKFMRPVAMMIDGRSSFDVGEATEQSITPPALAYVKMLSQAIASLASRDDLTPSERRNLERLFVVRNTLWAKLIGQMIGGEADEAATDARPAPRRYRYSADGRVSTPRSRRTHRAETIDALREQQRQPAR